jgi:hypothetical protein
LAAGSMAPPPPRAAHDQVRAATDFLALVESSLGLLAA